MKTSRLLLACLLFTSIVSAAEIKLTFRDFENDFRASEGWIIIEREITDRYISISSISHLTHNKQSNEVVLNFKYPEMDSIRIDLGKFNADERFRELLEMISPE